MSALDLALAALPALTAAWLAVWLHRRRTARRLARLAGAGAPRPSGRAVRVLLRRPLAGGGAVVAVAAGTALLAGGPVAAFIAGMYAVMALVAARRTLLRREGEHQVTALLDAVDAAAEGLRAGGSSTPEIATRPAGGAGVEAARARITAAQRLSESLGVPLADLLDRVEADLRSGQVLRGGVAAQLSAAHASTSVLLALPIAGLWVGAALGTDPAGQLLHTPFGAGCALTAGALQCGGFLWTSRMVHAATAEVR